MLVNKSKENVQAHHSVINYIHLDIYSVTAAPAIWWPKKALHYFRSLPSSAGFNLLHGSISLFRPVQKGSQQIQHYQSTFSKPDETLSFLYCNFTTVPNGHIKIHKFACLFFYIVFKNCLSLSRVHKAQHMSPCRYLKAELHTDYALSAATILRQAAGQLAGRSCSKHSSSTCYFFILRV